MNNPQLSPQEINFVGTLIEYAKAKESGNTNKADELLIYLCTIYIEPMQIMVQKHFPVEFIECCTISTSEAECEAKGEQILVLTAKTIDIMYQQIKKAKKLNPKLTGEML